MSDSMCTDMDCLSRHKHFFCTYCHGGFHKYRALIIHQGISHNRRPRV